MVLTLEFSSLLCTCCLQCAVKSNGHGLSISVSADSDWILKGHGSIFPSQHNLTNPRNSTDYAGFLPEILVSLISTRGDNWDYDTPMTSRSISFDSYLYLLFISFYWLQNRFLMILSPYLMVNYIPVLNDDIRILEESLEMLRKTQEAS